ncbi:PAS domain-containing protein [Sodalinema gerasimenkoae]|uniref:PAS domain-containing protein n=1 Tax=Sodalinema gerasimenkoae TaxID=2862348 RepID=UPI001356D19E|nr:PAS domain-containing protein [Sodalinema gerasimenkoae]
MDSERDRLTKLLRHVPGLVYELRQHPNGHFCLPYASENLGDIYGVSLSDVAVDIAPLFAAIHRADRQMVWESLQESAQSLGTWHSTHRVNQADGQCLWVSVYGTPERQPDGGTQWYGYLENVTPLQQAQQQSETKLRRIIDNLNEMVFIAAPDGTFSFVSSRFATTLGYAPGELLHTAFTPLVHPEDLPPYLEVFQSILAGERVQDYEYRVRHADGHYYWHSLNLSPFQEDNGKTACLGESSLIHSLKQAEASKVEQVEQKVNLLETIFDVVLAGYWEWDILND